MATTLDHLYLVCFWKESEMIRLHEFEREFILSDGLCVNLKTFSCQFFVLFCEESRLSVIVIPMERHRFRVILQCLVFFFLVFFLAYKFVPRIMLSQNDPIHRKIVKRSFVFLAQLTVLATSGQSRQQICQTSREIKQINTSPTSHQYSTWKYADDIRIKSRSEKLFGS